MAFGPAGLLAIRESWLFEPQNKWESCGRENWLFEPQNLALTTASLPPSLFIFQSPKTNPDRSNLLHATLVSPVTVPFQF
ncbi:hypothetical protein JCGZ_26551 [Jatropha curcas]|uniref:Uncharacterized protein n=1 Tax=Jatropha curcas TaxID=180498 RepID=A0A067JL06_JATCU|nr:hypothetical protein JCGZ_26551 [Jatropha curcas]